MSMGMTAKSGNVFAYSSWYKRDLCLPLLAPVVILFDVADFKPERACLENVLVSPMRGLDKLTLARFTTDAWITQATNVVLTGATGVGKTYLAEAIGAQACRGGHTVRKIRYKHLFEEINAARGTGCLLKYLRKIQQTSVLILDDFLMATVPIDDLTNLLEIIEERHQVASLIVTTQYPIAEWHRLIPDPTLADAICDRLAHTSVHIRLQGDSMRKRRASTETTEVDPAKEQAGN